MGWGSALDGMSPCCAPHDAAGWDFQEAPRELGCAPAVSGQAVEQERYCRSNENLKVLVFFLPSLPSDIASLWPEYPGADNWSHIRAAGAGASGSVLASGILLSQGLAGMGILLVFLPSCKKGSGGRGAMTHSGWVCEEAISGCSHLFLILLGTCLH